MHDLDTVKLWLSSVKMSHSGSEATRSVYQIAMNHFLEFSEITPEQINSDYQNLPERDFKHKYSQVLRAWIGELTENEYSPGSIGNFVTALKSYFKHNDFPLSDVLSVRKRVTFHNRDITKEDIQNILSVSGPRERAFYAVMAQSGLRPSTICALRLKHLEPDFSEKRTPVKVTVPEELTKGQYHDYITFLGEDAAEYLRNYLKTRMNLKPESFLFTNQGTEEPMIYNTISSIFRSAVRKIRKKGVMTYDQKKANKPAEIRLYNLRKYFRKYAIQAGFENVDYWMGHTGGIDAHYRPMDTEFYRKIYAEKAMPFLRLETSSPNETEKLVEDLKTKYESQIQELKNQIAEISKGGKQFSPTTLKLLETLEKPGVVEWILKQMKKEGIEQP